MRDAAAAGQLVRVTGSGPFVHAAVRQRRRAAVARSNLRASNRSTLEPALAWIRAGTKIHDLGGPLAEQGLALENQGDVDVQAIAGAVSTGTHGTGRTLGSISTQVVGLRIVTAGGEVLECSSEIDQEVFRAAQVSLGSLGVITAVRLRLLPLYRLHEQACREPLDACLTGLDAAEPRQSPLRVLLVSGR